MGGKIAGRPSGAPLTPCLLLCIIDDSIIDIILHSTGSPHLVRDFQGSEAKTVQTNNANSIGLRADSWHLQLPFDEGRSPHLAKLQHNKKKAEAIEMRTEASTERVEGVVCPCRCLASQPNSSCM